MTVQYYKRDVYGKTLYYLMPSTEASAILSLIGQKTISHHQIALLELLGLQFVEVIAP